MAEPIRKPVNPFDPTVPGMPKASYGSSWADLLSLLGYGPKPQVAAIAPQGVTVQATPPQSVNVRAMPPAMPPQGLPNPFTVPYTGLKNEMFPSQSEGDLAVAAPTQGLLAPYFQPKPAPAGPIAAPPVTVQADAPAPMPPRQSAADYGPAWNTPAAPGQYEYLNPTPSLESAFRQQYAANPNGFTPGRFFGLLGG